MATLEDLLKNIQSINEKIDNESDLIKHRKEGLAKYNSDNFVKNAYDARFIKQDDYHPRKNLSYYSRSDSFIKDPIKLKCFIKIKKICEEIHKEYYKHQEYNDSYSRILKNAVNNLLSKTKEGHFTYSEKNLSYFEQLIYNRYRLTPENVENLSDKELKTIILAKDENLLYDNLFSEGIVKQASKKYEDPMDEVEDFVNSLEGTNVNDE